MKEKTQRSVVDRNDPEAVYRHLFGPDPDEGLEGWAWVKNIDVKSVPRPDFPHSLHHIETVRAFSKVMAEVSGLGKYWKNTLNTAAIYHDISLGYTKVPQGPHPTASSVIAYMLTGNDDVADLILSHNEDDLDLREDEGSKALEILRDADQLALMGYAGLIRNAYYWGFRHELMESDPKEILDTMVLCDPRCNHNGLPQDYEEKVRLFALEQLFPFLIESKQIDRAMAHAQTNIQRFFGSPRLEISFLARLGYDKTMLEAVSKKKLKIDNWRFLESYAGEIQEINPKHSYLFIRKPLSDCLIFLICEHIQFLLRHFGEEEAKRSIKKSLPWK